MKISYIKGEVINNHKVIKLLDRPDYYPYMYLLGEHFTAMKDFTIEIIDEFIFLLS